MDPDNLAALKTELIRDEGQRAYAYQDSLGYWTIGIGHLIDRRGGGLKEKHITAIFEDDIADKCAELDHYLPWWRSLNPVRQRVLVNMSFMGVQKVLGFKNALAAMERGEYEAAADEMENSTWAHQVGARAARLANMMRLGA